MSLIEKELWEKYLVKLFFMKKSITSLFILLFVTFFGWIFWDEYTDFHKKASTVIEQNAKIQEQIQDFSLDDIRVLDTTDFYHTPYKTLLETLVWKINSAEERVYIEVYIFTETRIREAVKKAHLRWVDVQVILEKNPYLAPRLNDKVFQELKDFGIDIVWSDVDDYALNHTKIMIIDDTTVISTGNLSYSTFAYNKDFFIITEDSIIRDNLLYLFENDFQWDKVSPYEHNLVLSPMYARSKFTELFSSAEKSIYMYFQYFQDDNLESLLTDMSKSWVDVKAIVASNYWESGVGEIQRMESEGIEVAIMKTPKMHAKAILIDEKYLFIGSINFSNYSLDANREVGILISNPDIISKFIDLFQDDFQTFY